MMNLTETVELTKFEMKLVLAVFRTIPNTLFWKALEQTQETGAPATEVMHKVGMALERLNDRKERILTEGEMFPS